MAIIQPGGSGGGGGFANPMTTAGDLIVGGTGGAPTRLAAGAAGTFLGGAGTTYQYPPGFEIGYDQITSPVNVVSTTEATGTTIITCAAHTFDGSAVICEFFTPSVHQPTAAVGNVVVISLFESSTQVSRLGESFTFETAASSSNSLVGKFRFTPTAGSHTYTVTAFASSTTGTPLIQAGALGTAALPPAYVRFTKV